ncbi:hypothetical protein J1N35_043308 [Gossypium stocksii]|uniref:Uncharacterized protein n=1 Tax=Gossypium stocksii TaxID=47602 RepID=A0A9D3U7A4_9ROSI|nr:hypothetical protein J1N35_043308 [Gossypium stocksii]
MDIKKIKEDHVSHVRGSLPRLYNEKLIRAIIRKLMRAINGKLRRAINREAPNSHISGSSSEPYQEAQKEPLIGKLTKSHISGHS